MEKSEKNISSILVVDDNASIRKTLEIRLISSGYCVLLAKDGSEALNLVGIENPDLIVLDIRMPGIDGFQVCQEIRRELDIPIIMLSACSDISYRLKGLELGADDYMVKPFSPKELITRINGILRRASHPPLVFGDPGILRFDGLTIDTNKRKVFKRGQYIKLTETEFRFVEIMAKQPGTTVTRREFFQHILGHSAEPGHDMRLIDVHISRIRSLLHNNLDNKEYIFTDRGRGYWFLG